jgi:hypothetical protein
MVKIRPFAAVRPPKQYVEEVAARPYDVLNSAEAKAEADEAKYQKALKRLKLEARRNGQNPDAVTLNKAEYLASEEKPVEQVEGYVRTKYTTDEGKIAVVTYSNGVKFILNFNSFDVNVKYDGVDYTVKDLGFVKIK